MRFRALALQRVLTKFSMALKLRRHGVVIPVQTLETEKSDINFFSIRSLIRV